MIRLYRDSNGGLWFKNSAVAGSPRLRRYVEQRRLEGERQHAEHDALHERHMAMLGEPDPTPRREVLHVVKDETEEELWTHWRAYTGE